jgi:hypothetical protein
MTVKEIIKQLSEILSYYKDIGEQKPTFLDIEENARDIEALTYAIECIKASHGIKGAKKWQK